MCVIKHLFALDIYRSIVSKLYFNNKVITDMQKVFNVYQHILQQ